MERLTERDEYGKADIIALGDMMPELYAGLSFSEMNALTDAINRLAAYEDTGLSPEEVAPVRQAKWEICSDGYYPYCSACNTEPKGGEMTDYCPNCGATMKRDNKITKYAETTPRYVDANKISRALADDYAYVIAEFVDRQPTAEDVVKVVRCKDCKHFHPYIKPVEDFEGWCIARERETDEPEYCSYGKRKDDEP